jgi:hypothetical protein
MAERWTIRGPEFANCNCAWGCPCQFNAPSTHGRCEAVAAGRIEEGRFGDVVLDGLGWCLLLWWPGEIAEGNGREQAIIDERANPAQREALRKILHGEATTPGATHFYVFNSTVSEVLDPIYARFETLEIDVDARRARVSIPGYVDATGSPIVNPHSGEEFRARIDLPNGFEYRLAEVGTGASRTTAGIELSLAGTYGQFSRLHMNQDGVIG